MSKNSKILQLVEFVLHGNSYALPIQNVQEIIKLIEIVNVPKAPTFVEGVINLRDKIVPVIDLKKRFSLKAKSIDNSTMSSNTDNSSRIIISDISNYTVGLIVDHVHQVIDVDESSFEKKPDITTSIDQDFIAGMVKHKNKIIIILNPLKILTSSETSNLNIIECNNRP
ncbi:MAG: chemotaxis protein CheW [Oligoflexia bacterium]|nr:chemotaxis protein CheW [Oligoflexia bacterium]